MMSDQVEFIERYEKACACEGPTASGPRFILIDDRLAYNAKVLSCRVIYARVSCDACNTPWNKVQAKA